MWLHLGALGASCTVTCSVSIPPSSECLSLFLWLERKSMGGAPLHSTGNHKPAPGLEYRMYPDFKPHPCGLGRPRGRTAELSHYIVLVTCLATDLGFLSTQTMGYPKGLDLVKGQPAEGSAKTKDASDWRRGPRSSDTLLGRSDYLWDLRELPVLAIV